MLNKQLNMSFRDIDQNVQKMGMVWYGILEFNVPLDTV